jgi:hypothetical protein
MHRPAIVSLVAFLSVFAVSCGNSSAPPSKGHPIVGSSIDGKAAEDKPFAQMTAAERSQAEKTLVENIEAVAQRADRNFEDGWICNRNARVLKTGYARVSPKAKAQFALAYRKMIEAQGENLATDVTTYVPYKKRADFALDYWRKSDSASAFEAETTKKKVQWIYESMLDAGELFWRAYEILHPQQVNSAAVLAHYKEQDMVFNYMEDEGTPGSFSDQYVKWVAREKAGGKTVEQAGEKTNREEKTNSDADGTSKDSANGNEQKG